MTTRTWRVGDRVVVIVGAKIDGRLATHEIIELDCDGLMARVRTTEGVDVTYWVQSKYLEEAEGGSR